jgi:hypothetical protein
MKKIAVLAVAILGLFVVQPVQAVETKTIAIIDTAVDSDKNPNVVYEVCFTHNSTCQNKSNFQEGKNSARVNDWKIKGADHGFNMAQVAVQTDPNIKIVFIRIADEKVYDSFSMIRNDGKSLARALDWVSKNAAKFNISAVSISQSRSNFPAGTCPTDSLFESAVATLNSNNIPTFVATGNDSKKNQVGFPACVSGVVGVGALKPTSGVKPYPASAYSAFASYTNVGPGLDIVTRGDADVRGYCGCKDMTITGTSVATPIAAVLAVNKNELKTSWDSFFLTLTKSVNYPYISK